VCTAHRLSASGSQLAEGAGEALLADIVEIDVTEHQGLVLFERRPQGGDGRRIQLIGEIDPGDLGADMGGDFADFEIGGSGRECSHSTSLFC
jgi:hypothetical protein